MAPVEVQHVPPNGTSPGRFVVRLDTAVAAKELEEDGEPSDEAYVAYYQTLDSDDKIVLFHTWTPRALRGRGLAAQVTQAAFDFAEKKRKRIVPQCSYVSDTFLAKHPDLKRLVG
ncbi:N-acetyltransferase [bacterium]|jgi:hypothetical protein|nr:N-acetyltransferase [bacterium]|tara:strand:+ start:2301 stop:2645 length:345 start_codon:yes stop_codon:yes gene_type:complete